MELPLKSGDEQDALTRWRRYLRWRPGQKTRVKRSYRRRVRAWAKHQTKKEAYHE